MDSSRLRKPASLNLRCRDPVQLQLCGIDRAADLVSRLFELKID